MNTTTSTPAPAAGPVTAHVGSLLRHFGDLRDGTHGEVSSRRDKEALFAATVPLLDPYARQVLAEMNTQLLHDTGEVQAGGVQRTPDGSLVARWALTWPEQRETGIDPISLIAYFGRGFHHPHLRGATVAEWPLNVFTEEQAAAEVPTLRAIAAADLHNLVFQRDFRIVPEVVRPLDGDAPAPGPHSVYGVNGVKDEDK
ncbi:hypothetical protein ACH44C_33805 [Streptomyces purpureus]|uniref:hypothetical protein n=1 Tax=Streptomyces purpureus TaxID=1951 RepID=UPI0037934BB6